MPRERSSVSTLASTSRVSGRKYRCPATVLVCCWVLPSTVFQVRWILRYGTTSSGPLICWL